MECDMNNPEKQLKYSIRKVSVGAASVVIGALYLLMGAGIAHAEGVESDKGVERTASLAYPERSGYDSSVNGTVYEVSPARNIEMSSGETNEEATDTSLVSDKEYPPSSESNDSGVSSSTTKEIFSNKETESSRDKTEEVDKTKIRRKRSLVSTDIKYQPKFEEENLGEAKTISIPEGEHYQGEIISYMPEEITIGSRTYVPVVTGPKVITLTGQPQTEEIEYVDKSVAESINKRKGSVFSKNLEWVKKDDKSPAGDENAHLTFEMKDGATVEEMFKALENLPDDFQNNERSYLRNMDTLGDALGLKPGEIRELTEFGGWKAIDKDGVKGKFVIGRRNKDGYFTGWRVKGYNADGTPIIEQGGMLGGDGLDNVYVHEQALDRRFKYMLMLAKGRTRANRTEEVSDGKAYDPHAPNERYSSNLTALEKLPLVERDKHTKYSPNVKGFNGIEKKFSAFSTKYGSRVKVEFVTGYISDINGSKGTYRVVVKAQKSDGTEETVYDQTIHRIDTVVQNEDLYKKGLKLEPDGNLKEADATRTIKKILDYELNRRSIEIQNKKLAEHGLNKNTLSETEKKFKKQLSEEAKEEAKQSDIVMEVSEEALKEDKLKETLPGIGKNYTKTANELNNFLKTVIKEPTDPTWTNSVRERDKAHDPDRVYKLLRLLLPQASKITYHPEEGRLEIENNYVSPETKTILEEIKEKNEAITATKDKVERDKLVEARDELRNKLKDKYSYTYLQAQNGKETIIQGSTIIATGTANEYNITRDMLERTRTNTKANSYGKDGIVKGGEEYSRFGHIVGTDKIERPADKVLTDDQLSNKIKEKLGEGDSKLGKGGYFSSGDIPLGKDVVSYTVQVFSEDNERVGVNTQSHRIQYNLPFLADFSVIQDTVEPAKEVSRRIIDKLVKEKKIPEDKGRKIKEKIEKVKKTSELKELLKGSVKVRYVDTNGNELKEEKYLKSFVDKDGNTANITDKPGEFVEKVLEEITVPIIDKDGNTLENGTHTSKNNVVDRDGNVVLDKKKNPVIETIKTELFVKETTDRAPEFLEKVRVKNVDEHGKTVIKELDIHKTIHVSVIDSKTGKVKEIKEYKKVEQGGGITNKEVMTPLTNVLKIHLDAKDDIPLDGKIVNEDGNPISFSKLDIKTDVKTTVEKVAKQKISYVDKAGNVVLTKVTIKDNNNHDQEVFVPKEEETTENRAGFLGLMYRNTFDEKADNIISTRDGKRYRVRRTLADNQPERTDDSATASGELTPGETVVTYVYEELGKALVHVVERNEDGTTKSIKGQDDFTIDGIVGKEFPQNSLDEKIAELKKLGYDVVENTFATGNRMVDNNSDEEKPSQEYTITVEKSKQAGVIANYYKDGTSEKVADSDDQGQKNIGSYYETTAKTIEPKVTVEEKDGKIIVTTKTYTLKEEPTNKTGKVVTGGVVVNYYYVDKTEVKEVPITEEKTVTRTINYLEKGTNKALKKATTQSIKLTKTNTVNKERNGVTEGIWTTGIWDMVIPGAIENYKTPEPTSVAKVEVNSTTIDTIVNVYYELIPRQPERPNPQGTDTPDSPTPQQNPENPSILTPIPEIPNQETPMPPLSPASEVPKTETLVSPDPEVPKTETLVSPDPEVPTSETGKREELPNTGTKANAGLAGAGLLTLLAGLGLGFFKKEDEK